MYHFSNHQLYHQNTYQQHCPVFVDHTKHPSHSVIPPATSMNQFETVDHSSVSMQPDIIRSSSSQQLASNTGKGKKAVSNKSNVDTSNYSIEERLVAAVWVHDRKRTKTSMSQIRHEFRQRFDRESPAKNTLLVWERKLFSTGSVHDAPRPGRPVNRRSHGGAVLSSLRAAPALSLRARARALRLPRSTLRAILLRDLAHAPHAATGKHQTKKHVRRKQEPPPDDGARNHVVTTAAE